MDTTTAGTDNRRRRLCRYFASGHCSRGDSCRFRHDQPASPGASRQPAPPGVCRKFYSTGTCSRRNTPAGCKYRHERPRVPNTAQSSATARPSTSSPARNVSRAGVRATRRNVGGQSSANGHRGATVPVVTVGVPPVAASSTTPAGAPAGNHLSSQNSGRSTRRSQQTQPRNAATPTAVRVVVPPRVQRESRSTPRTVGPTPVPAESVPGNRSTSASHSVARQSSRAAYEGARSGNGDSQGRATTWRALATATSAVVPIPPRPPQPARPPVITQSSLTAPNVTNAPIAALTHPLSTPISARSLPGFPSTVIEPNASPIPPASRGGALTITAPIARRKEAELCAICYDVPVLYGVLCGCRHIFCSKCIDSWRSSGQEMARKCPICRVYSCHSAASGTPIPDTDEGKRGKQRLFAAFHTHPTGPQYSDSAYSSWFETSPRSPQAAAYTSSRPANAATPSSLWEARRSGYAYAAPPMRSSDTRQGSNEQATREAAPPGIATALVTGVATLAVAAYRWWRATG